MDSLKILFVGNSFAVDTMEHTANIARSPGNCPGQVWDAVRGRMLDSDALRACHGGCGGIYLLCE